MAGTRSSTRQAAASSSSPNSSPAANAKSTGTKRKGDAPTGPKSKRGKKSDGKEQATLEATMPAQAEEDNGNDVEMKDDIVDNEKATEAVKAVETRDSDEKNACDVPVERERAAKTREDAVEAKEGGYKNENANSEHGREEVVSNDKPNRQESNSSSKTDDTGKIKPEHATDKEAKGDTFNSSYAVEESSKRESSTPTSILEKGIIYFFFRGRVGIDEPSEVNDIARSYIVLRPIPHGSKLGDGPIGDVGTNRLLALPKKVLPRGPKDRFMVFVEKANSSMEDIKSIFSSSDYVTQTAGSRHTPAAAPIGEGVYAITSTGRDSHLAYILTIPSEISDIQKDVGLKERGSFVTSVKNPQYPGPANTNLPQGPEFPQEILDEFRSLRWMPLQPKLLDFDNTQFLLIGHANDDIEKATEQQPRDEKNDKDTPLEELEKLEHEDELRVEHLRGDDSIFEDLGLSSKEYPKVQTTW